VGVVRVGTCAWSDHTGFYPSGLRPADRLPYYARFFPLVEVDSTFYHPTSARQTGLWAARTPQGFRFHVKAYRVLTWHDRTAIPDPATLREHAAAFRAAVAPLHDAGKLAALHFQFPPWFVVGPDTRAYLEAVREALPDLPLAVEFRHRSWFAPQQTDATLALLAALGVAHTVCDEPQVGQGSVPTVWAVTWPRLAVVRFHGRNRTTWYRRTPTTGERFRYRYSREELAACLEPLRELARQADAVHVLFNNNYQDSAVRNAAELAELLGLGYPDPWAPA
jgi:uncharacterized protein YecE (DUF72 family)